jgi:hypothetical protein
MKLKQDNIPSTFSFKDFYANLQNYEQNLIARRKRIEENMNKQNSKPPTIDVNGRYHAPYDGYQWSDGYSNKSFLGGEYLPVDDFTEENNYYKLSKIPVTEALDIPYPIVSEMVNMGLSQEGNTIHIKRHNNNQAHFNQRKIKVVTCEIITSKWHFDYFSNFIEHYEQPLYKHKLYNFFYKKDKA